MAKQIFAIILLIFVSCGINGDVLPSYITPCQRNDPIINQCVKQQLVKALPNVRNGINGGPPMDPLKLSKPIEIKENQLNLSLDKATVTGLCDSKVTSVEFVPDKKFCLQFKTDIVLAGTYTIDGKILIMAIKGDGDAVIKAKGTYISMCSKLNIKKKNNEDFYKLGSIEFNHTIDNTHFDLSNLFGGKKELAEPVLKYANENSGVIMDSFGTPAIKQIVTVAVETLQHYLFDKIPVKELLL